MIRPGLLRPIPILTCALALGLGACTSDTAAKSAESTATASTTPKNVLITPEQRQRIHIVTVQVVAFRPVVEATGNVAFNGDKSTQVLSPVSGPVTRVVANPGANVHRGEPLAYVSSPDFAAAVGDYRKAQTAIATLRIADRDWRCSRMTARRARTGAVRCGAAEAT